MRSGAVQGPIRHPREFTCRATVPSLGMASDRSSLAVSSGTRARTPNSGSSSSRRSSGSSRSPATACGRCPRRDRWSATRRRRRPRSPELQKTLEQRDKLLARALGGGDPAVRRGRRVPVLRREPARAGEWGVRAPGRRCSARLLLRLTPPPEGKEYVVAARTGSGEVKALGDVVPGTTAPPSCSLGTSPRARRRSSCSSGRAAGRVSTAPSRGCRLAIRGTAPAALLSDAPAQARRGRGTRG